MVLALNEVHSDENMVKLVMTKQQPQHPTSARRAVGSMGSRRIFAPSFKIKVLDSYRQDIDCRGNQRATARKYGIHRRQIQKWLQSEQTLRSCCADSAASGNNNDSGEITVTQGSRNEAAMSEGTAESIGFGVAPASPALNLSLARLHGDELTVQQGPPPPPHPHPPSHGSPSTADYGFHASLPLHSSASACPEYTALREELYPRGDKYEEETIVIQELHSCKKECSEYYTSNPKEYVHEASSVFNNRSEVKQYQPLATYHWSPNHRYGCDNDASEAVSHLHNTQHLNHQLSQYHHHQHQQLQERYNYENLNSPGDGKIHNLLLAPAKIKTERASPDSAATPGPYETARSPDAGRTSLSPPRHTAVTTTSVISAYTDLPSIHTRSPVHAHVSDHAHVETSDSVKPRQHREGQPKETAKAAAKEPVVKEERELVEREPEEENEEGEGGSCIDYQRPPAASSLTGSTGPSSPPQDRIGTFSESSSPEDTGSSDRSTSSFSDSDVDGMEKVQLVRRKASGDRPRRRSFSLRFKLQVLDSFYNEEDVSGNQRGTARKYGINRRQVQKWLNQERKLRGTIGLCSSTTRQRLGPIQDAASAESSVDLCADGHISTQQEPEHGQSPVTHVKFCDPISSPAGHSYPQSRYGEASEMAYRPCNLACCTQKSPTSSQLGYQDMTLKRPSDPKPYVSSSSSYNYSRQGMEDVTLPDQGVVSTSLKRAHCNLACCCEESLPKRLIHDTKGSNFSRIYLQPPQEIPLCLVMPKNSYAVSPSPPEPVSSTVPTPPSSAVAHPTESSTKKDGILFRPYLDNPIISKPSDHSVPEEVLPLSNSDTSRVNFNNNNCQGAYNFNAARDHNLALELSFGRLPVVWGSHPTSYSEYPPVRSAFVRYPTSPHYN